MEEEVAPGGQGSMDIDTMVTIVSTLKQDVELQNRVMKQGFN
jgi:hypothetical protein